jgi:hypothetical protein
MKYPYFTPSIEPHKKIYVLDIFLNWTLTLIILLLIIYGAERLGFIPVMTFDFSEEYAFFSWGLSDAEKVLIFYLLIESVLLITSFCYFKIRGFHFIFFKAD